MDDGRSAFKILNGTPIGKKRLGRSRRMWEDSIRMDLKEIEKYEELGFFGSGMGLLALNLRVP